MSEIDYALAYGFATAEDPGISYQLRFRPDTFVNGSPWESNPTDNSSPSSSSSVTHATATPSPSADHTCTSTTSRPPSTPTTGHSCRPTLSTSNKSGPVSERKDSTEPRTPGPASPSPRGGWPGFFFLPTIGRFDVDRCHRPTARLPAGYLTALTFLPVSRLPSVIVGTRRRSVHARDRAAQAE
jgi:hypothetical protein